MKLNGFRELLPKKKEEKKGKLEREKIKCKMGEIKIAYNSQEDGDDARPRLLHSHNLNSNHNHNLNLFDHHDQC